MKEDGEFIATTIEDALRRQTELEGQIADLCAKYEEETKLSICEIQYFKIGHGLTESETKHVNVTVKL